MRSTISVLAAVGLAAAVPLDSYGSSAPGGYSEPASSTPVAPASTSVPSYPGSSTAPGYSVSSASGWSSGSASGYPSGSASGYPSGSASGYPSGSASWSASGSVSGYPSGSASWSASASSYSYSIYPTGGYSGYPTGGYSIYPTGSYSVSSSTVPSASATPSCWAACFQKAGITAESQLCGNTAVDQCIQDTCSAAEDKAYWTWYESYCSADPTVTGGSPPSSPTGSSGSPGGGAPGGGAPGGSAPGGGECNCPLQSYITVTKTETVYPGGSIKPTHPAGGYPGGSPGGYTTETITSTLGNGETTCITRTHTVPPYPYSSSSQGWYPTGSYSYSVSSSYPVVSGYSASGSYSVSSSYPVPSGSWSASGSSYPSSSSGVVGYSGSSVAAYSTASASTSGWSSAAPTYAA